MDRECADSFVAALLATVDGPQTRRGLGERQGRRLSCIRKLRLYCECHTTFCTLCNSARQNCDSSYERETYTCYVVPQYVVVTVCAKAGLIINSWTWVTHLATWGSIILWFLFIFIYR